MKKIIVSILLSGILTLSSCGKRGQGKESSETETAQTQMSEEETAVSHLEVMESVEEKVDAVKYTEEYESGNLKTKIEMLEEVFEQLQEQEVILEYEVKRYSINHNLVSFTYADGTEDVEAVNIDRKSYADLAMYRFKKTYAIKGTEEYKKSDTETKFEMLEPVFERLQEQGVILEYKVVRSMIQDDNGIVFTYADGTSDDCPLEELDVCDKSPYKD